MHPSSWENIDADIPEGEEMKGSDALRSRTETLVTTLPNARATEEENEAPCFDLYIRIYIPARSLAHRC